MSRSGYSDDCDDWWSHIKWRGMVASATRGRRGQTLLKEMLAALDAMPQKRLIANKLHRGGDFCAIGSVGAARRMDMRKLDPDNTAAVAAKFNIAECLVQEIVFMNDEGFYGATPESRWTQMRAWVAEQVKPEPQP